MSEVNYAEVKYSILRKDGPAAWTKAASALQALLIDFSPTSLEASETAADFAAKLKLSLADAFAAALAKERRAELVTGDPETRPRQRNQDRLVAFRFNEALSLALQVVCNETTVVTDHLLPGS